MDHLAGIFYEINCLTFEFSGVRLFARPLERFVSLSSYRGEKI